MIGMVTCSEPTTKTHFRPLPGAVRGRRDPSQGPNTNVKLKRRNKEAFGRVEGNKKATLKRITLWDTVETQRALSISEMEAKVEALEDLKDGLFWKKRHGGRNLGRSSSEKGIKTQASSIGWQTLTRGKAT